MPPLKNTLLMLFFLSPVLSSRLPNGEIVQCSCYQIIDLPGDEVIGRNLYLRQGNFEIADMRKKSGHHLIQVRNHDAALEMSYMPELSPGVLVRRLDEVGMAKYPDTFNPADYEIITDSTLLSDQPSADRNKRQVLVDSQIVSLHPTQALLGISQSIIKIKYRHTMEVLAPCTEDVSPTDYHDFINHAISTDQVTFMEDFLVEQGLGSMEELYELMRIADKE